MRPSNEPGNIVSTAAPSVVSSGRARDAHGPSARVVAIGVDPSSQTTMATVEVTGFPAGSEIELGQCVTTSAQQTVCSEMLVRVHADVSGAATASVPVSRTFTGRDIATVEAVEVNCGAEGTISFVVATAFTTGSVPALIRVDAPLAHYARDSSAPSGE